jgi:hypothetical protein
MPRKYLAFDIETAAVLPGTSSDWRMHRPLGICCAAATHSDLERAIVWHGKKADGSPSPRMTKTELRSMVNDLLRFVRNDGFTLLTWNGVGFDLDVLRGESGLDAECRQLAWNHVDMMLHVHCRHGYPVGLEKTALALDIPGKAKGMTGALAPQYWADGRHEEVLAYVRQDVSIALQIAQKCERQRRFEWITSRGTKSSFRLGNGWLTVREALALPEPDTAWMDNPIPRRGFTEWLLR